MNLPPGFTLDSQNTTPTGLPPGFALDVATQQDQQGRAPRGVRETPSDYGQTNAFITGAAQGATFGMSDELAAAEAASPVSIRGQREQLSQSASRDLKLPFTLPTVPSLPDVIAGGARMLAEKVAPGYFGNAGTQAYDAKASQERADIRTAQDQYPLTTLGGNMVGGAAVPLGAANTAAQGAKVGAATGAAMGFGTGEGLAGSAQQAAIGAGLGGALGGALGAVSSRVQPSGAPSTPNAVIQASENLGVPVPRAVASDSALVQRAGQGVRNVPGAGEAIVRAQAETIDQLGQKASGMASDIGAGDLGTAGQAALGSIRDWMTGKSKDAVSSAYKAVDGLVDNSVLTPLSATQGRVASILADRQASRIQDPGQAVNFVANAVQDASGLSYEGVKGLRTRVGEMLKNPSILPAGTIPTELKQIYAALSDDLRSAVQNSGGDKALSAFERANKLNELVQARRKDLAKIVGTNADAPVESVLNKLTAMASSSQRGDAALLAKAKSAMEPSDWSEVSSAVIAKIGRDKNGNLTADRFATDWGKISDAGKSMLFTPEHRSALQDIATISRRFQEVGRKFGNPSGTAQNVGFSAALGGMTVAPIPTLSTLVGGNIMARALAAPATASSIAKWSRAYEAAVIKPTAATVSGLQIASRNLSANMSEKIGASIKPEDILKAIAGPRASYSEPNQEK